MNYQKVYKDLIANAKSKIRKKKQGIYYEQHHIIPRCFNGTNAKENLVLLTAKEHYVAHHLLSKIYPNNVSITCAFWAMQNYKSQNQERIYGSASTYEKTKIAFAKICSEKWKQDNPNNYRSIKGSNNPMYGSSRTGETNPFYGKTHTDETKKRLSDAAKIRRNGSDTHNRKAVIINDIYFESITSASSFFNIKVPNIIRNLKSVKHPNWNYVISKVIEG